MQLPKIEGQVVASLSPYDSLSEFYMQRVRCTRLLFAVSLNGQVMHVGGVVQQWSKIHIRALVDRLATYLKMKRVEQWHKGGHILHQPYLRTKLLKIRYEDGHSLFIRNMRQKCDLDQYLYILIIGSLL